MYITLRDFPREVANRIQTIEMADALSNFFEVTLTVTQLHVTRERLHQHYGLKNSFFIRKLGDVRIGKSIVLMPRILQLLYRYKPTHIYIREEYPALILSKIFKNVVYEIHDFDQKKRWIYASIIKNCRLVIAISNGLVATLNEHGIISQKIRVLPCGTDLSRFQRPVSKLSARTTLKLPTKKHLVLYSGRMKEEKGIYTLVDSMQLLPNKAMLVLVGGFEFEVGLIKKYIEQKNLNARVIVCGFQEHSKIPLYLHAADVLVIPNSNLSKISRSHTSPLKLFEYMAANRPIIASDLPSIREIVDEDSVLFVKPDSTIELAKGIERTLDEQSKTAVRVKNAKRKVHSFSIHDRAKEIWKLLEHAKN